jgi:hypothetical protein
MLTAEDFGVDWVSYPATPSHLQDNSMRVALRSSLLFASFSAAAILPAHANLITNGSFETGNFSGWNVTAGATGVAAAGGPGGYSPYDGNYYAYLGNVGLPLGTISQTITDTPGQTYTLGYYLASNGTTPNEFETSIDGVTVFDQTDITTQPYTLYSFNFVGTGSDTITFGERNDPNYLALDDVSVNPASTRAIPEPSSLLLLATGMAGVAGAVRRRLRFS